MPRKRQRSVNCKDLNLDEAPSQPKNAQKEIIHPEEAPEKDFEAPGMHEPFVDPNGFTRYFFKGGGWISYHKDFVFTRRLDRYRGPACRNSDSSDGPSPPKKKKGKAPAELSNWAVEIIINCFGAGHLALKRDSQLKARPYIPEDLCVFTNTEYVRCFLSYQCILVEEDGMAAETTGLAENHLMVAVIELADIRGRVYMMLQEQESLGGSRINEYMKLEPECVLDERSHDSAYEGAQTSNSPTNSTQSIPEQMDESGGNSNDYVGDQEGRVFETFGKIAQPPMVRIPRNNLIDQIHHEFENYGESSGFPNSPSTDDTPADERAQAMANFLCFYQNLVLAKTAVMTLNTHEMNRVTGDNGPLGTSALPGVNIPLGNNTRPDDSTRPVANVIPVLNARPCDNTPLVADAPSDASTPLVFNALPIANDSSETNASSSSEAPLAVDALPIANDSSEVNASSSSDAPLVVDALPIGTDSSEVNASSRSDAPLVVDALPIANDSSEVDASSIANAPLVANDSSTANLRPSVDAPSCSNVRPIANVCPGVTAPPRPLNGKKTMKEWRELAKNDDILRTYLDEIYLWNLVQLHRPEWKSFPKPVPPIGYPMVPTADEYDKSYEIRPENMTSRQKHSFTRAITRLLQKLHHRSYGKNSRS